MSAFPRVNIKGKSRSEVAVLATALQALSVIARTGHADNGYFATFEQAVKVPGLLCNVNFDTCIKVER